MSEQLLQQILTEMQSTNQRLDRMETDISTMKTDILTMKTDILTMKTDILTMKTDISTIQENMATKVDIVLLPMIQQAVLDTNQNVLKASETLERVVEGTVRQGRILESLSMRSLEQETELRELKRVK